jgi:uncharacterized protein (DUF924 family)
MDPQIDAVHDFWFGPLDEAGLCAPQQHDLWFTSSDDIDNAIRERFGELTARATAGGLQDWESSDRGLVALVILLDQFNRNIHRGTPAAFAGDERALALAQHYIETGHYRRLPAIHQGFLYMPLEHCEDLEVQEECVTLFEELAAITGSQMITDYVRYAVGHRDVIARFGRFPHRNAILGRTSTPEELAYLEKHGGF